MDDTMRVLRREDHQEMPWRNGGGSTLEVARSPEDGDLADFDWRISIARVEQDGPFSAFPGVDRVITLVDGGRMHLTCTDPYAAPTCPGATGGRPGEVELTRQQPFAFAGECEVDCRVTAPTTDLNVMTRRGRVAATVTTHDVASGLDLPAEADADRAVVALSGAPEVTTPDGHVRLTPLDVVVGQASSTQVAGSGVVAVVLLEVRRQP